MSVSYRSGRLRFLPLAALLLAPAAAFAQDEGEAHAELIENALSAAPASVAEGATVVSLDGEVLREGTNGYTCMPDDPATEGNSPMCLDAIWSAWVAAYAAGEAEPPPTTTLGVSYMLQGGSPVSNTDPFAEGPTEDNEWIEYDPPHIMLIVPDPAMLEGMPTDPDSGQPYVMWRDTPYVHVMMPMPAAD